MSYHCYVVEVKAHGDKPPELFVCDTKADAVKLREKWAKLGIDAAAWSLVTGEKV